MTSFEGITHIQSTESGGKGINIEDEWEYVSDEDIKNKKVPFLSDAKTQLEEYFAGQRFHFELKYDAHGTEFQKVIEFKNHLIFVACLGRAD